MSDIASEYSTGERVDRHELSVRTDLGYQDKPRDDDPYADRDDAAIAEGVARVFQEIRDEKPEQPETDKPATLFDLLE